MKQPVLNEIGPLAPNRGLRAHRLTTDQTGFEVAFALQWEAECKGQPAVNGGWGMLDLLCSEADDVGGWMGLGYGSRHPLIALDDSHRVVVATVMQWLGTNVGRGFLDEAFKAAGYRLNLERRRDAGTGSART